MVQRTACDPEVAAMKTGSRVISNIIFALLILLCPALTRPLSAQQVQYEAVHFAEEAVSFGTEDGWTIYGTLTKPLGLSDDRPVAASLFLHASSHDQDLFSRSSYPGFRHMQNKFVTLRIDIRGRAKSQGQLELHSFTPQQLESLYLDVKAALNFLAAQRGVDASRIGIFAEEMSADSAVLGAVGDPRVKALVFISGRLSPKAKTAIAASPQIPVLCVVSSEDREGFADMSDAYKLSKNHSSDIIVANGLGLAAAMFSSWRYNHTSGKALDETVVDWLIGRLNELGFEQEVSFKTEDGWLISGDLVNQITEQPSPAVILVHSSVTDRNMYRSLQQALVENGFVVLNIDYRGRGKSRNKGNWLDLRLGTPAEVAESDRGYLDVKAAVDYLSSHGNVDPARIGIVGTVIGARFALLGASVDKRIKSAVSVIGYIPPEPEKKILAELKIPVLFVLSRDLVGIDREMTALYERTRANGSELMVVNGGTYGYAILKLNPDLEPAIVDWMRKELSQSRGR
jgi:dienelactone hydrolase